MGKSKRTIRQGCNLDSLLSAPLVAVSKANMMMLSGQTSFILNNCFTKENGIYHPVMVTMSISRNTSDGKEVSLNFQLPILSLLPLNSLAIESVRLNFHVDITAAYTYASKDKTNLLERKSALNGRIVKHGRGYEESNTHMTVDINTNTISLPLGIKNLVELYSKSIPLEEYGNKAESTT